MTISEIIAIGAQHNLGPGAVLIMISKNYGYSWNTIPPDRMDEMALFIKNSWFREVEIVLPETHQKLMESDNDYSLHFRLCEKGKFVEARKYELPPEQPKPEEE